MRYWIDLDVNRERETFSYSFEIFDRKFVVIDKY